MTLTEIIILAAAGVAAAAGIAVLIAIGKLSRKSGTPGLDQSELDNILLRAFREEDGKRREETDRLISSIDAKLRENEDRNSEFLKDVTEKLVSVMNQGNSSTKTLFETQEQQMTRVNDLLTSIRTSVSTSLSELQKDMNATIESFRTSSASEMEKLREENRVGLEAFRTKTSEEMTSLREDNRNSLESFRKNTSDEMRTLREDNRTSFESFRAETRSLSEQVRKDMDEIRTGNEKKLDEMRATVDEKLTSTLDERLGKSFALVTDNLNNLREALGEINKLSQDVGDLNKLFGNVKSRGVWGEVQVESILSDILSPDQYERNFHARPKSQEAVEFAIRLPGKDDGNVYIPIDSKFPKEDYERYVTAVTSGDHEAAELSLHALRDRVRHEAMDINQKYINPPRTTDFAILFVPTESLYAEILRMPGFSDELRNRYSVILSGPTTFSALVVSLQMGFRTLQIEKKTKEVSDLFSKIKLYMARFGKELEATQKSLDAASKKVDRIIKTNGQITMKLNSVEMADPDALSEDERTLLIEEECPISEI